jgi:hypothetical protein
MNTVSSEIRRITKRWLSLVVAPGAISLLAIIITNAATTQANPPWLWILTLIVMLVAATLYLIGYSSLLEGILERLSAAVRARQYRNPKVLIIDGTLFSDPGQIPPTPAHTDRTPTDWRSAFVSLGWKANIGPVTSIEAGNLPEFLLNPFGEVYPEEDFVSSKTINQIRNYVWNGGVYINVAGIPFWYRYDPWSGKRETAGRVEGVFKGQAAWRSLFYDYFPNLTPEGEPHRVEASQSGEEISRFGDIAHAGSDITVGRFRAYPLNPPQLIPILRNESDSQCIVGVHLYGKGAFIFFGVFIQGTNNSFEKVVASVEGWAKYESNRRNP